MTAKMKLEDKSKTVISAVCCCIAGIGLYLFLRNGMTDYMFFRAAFAFLDGFGHAVKGFVFFIAYLRQDLVRLL
jgi:hypothetical protein